ncbi:MAG TPA: phosphopantetheine-binding protein [Bryobacteraceae bacterium]|nr:phosphopantetheine-binding protein [Bryobacteraceae bacterium]
MSFLDMPDLLATNDLDTRVFAVIAKTQRIPIESISLESTFEELKIDSLDGINIVFELENTFDVAIPDDGVQNMHSVRDTVEGIRKLIEQKNKASSSVNETA